MERQISAHWEQKHSINFTVHACSFEWVASKRRELTVIRWTHAKTRFLPIGNDVQEIPTRSLRVFKWKEDSVIQRFIY